MGVQTEEGGQLRRLRRVDLERVMPKEKRSILIQTEDVNH
jgi:hypothetical protein